MKNSTFPLFDIQIERTDQTGQKITNTKRRSMTAADLNDTSSNSSTADAATDGEDGENGSGF